MLKKNAAERPTIHQLLKVPVIERRIDRFLTGTAFMDEFSHTLLHNQNVFEEFKRIKSVEEQKQAAAAQAEQQAAAEYQPPQRFMQQYNDPTFFNHEYQRYR